jgi:hypothetical protein
MIDRLRRIEGLFVGQLDEDELEIFDEACRRNEAYRSYEGGSGFMGLAKVRLNRFFLSLQFGSR